MPEFIQLLSTENTAAAPSRKTAGQRLSFLLLVADLDYDKRVDVLWTGRDGTWRTLPAAFLSRAGGGYEYWRARTSFTAAGRRTLPGDIRFAVRLRCRGEEHWDNNLGWNYESRFNSGVRLAEGRPLQNLSPESDLKNGRDWVEIKIAADTQLCPGKPVVRWSTGDWQDYRETVCRRSKQPPGSRTALWRARLPAGGAFRLQYAVYCETPEKTQWDNNRGSNYTVARDALKVLILNLHCYQEQQQAYKFRQIAKAITELHVDVACFQEVAEPWNDGRGDWATNAANLINRQLGNSMHIHYDWSHLGFDRYREGVAILSRFPLLHRDAGYVSASNDAYDIHARKVVLASLDVPYIGSVNIFSAHLSWWEDGFQQQFANLAGWAGNLAGTTLLCGDFNVSPGSDGYRQVVERHHYQDQFLAAGAGANAEAFRVNDAHWRNVPADDYRIDYIFMKPDSGLQATTARVLFTERDYGRVSDHCGYLISFEPKPEER